MYTQQQSSSQPQQSYLGRNLLVVGALLLIGGKLGIDFKDALSDRTALDPDNVNSGVLLYNLVSDSTIRAALRTPEVTAHFGNDVSESGKLTESCHRKWRFFKHGRLLSVEGYRNQRVPIKGNNHEGWLVMNITRQGGVWKLKQVFAEDGDYCVNVLHDGK